MSLPEHEVIIAGAGPVGLWLAAELKIAGVDVVVLEKEAERVPHSKALAVYPRTLELFAMRGLVERWLAEGTPVSSSHFALLRTRLDFSSLDSRYPFTLFFPQLRTEELLEEHALSLGVPLLREHSVTSASQDDEGVTVAVETRRGPAAFRAQYVVGCEGGSSPVRKSAGIELVGSPATLHCIMGDVEVSEPPDVPTITLNGDTGAMFMVRLGESLFRVAPFDPVGMQHARTEEPTLAELRACVRRVAGTDFGMHTARWLTRYGNATLQASRYRSGRLLLAGDAAHLFFPLGGQGLNLGLQDATNLAWKLAATVRGWAPPGLLDSYHDERHPVGAEVVGRHPRANGAGIELDAGSPGAAEALRRDPQPACVAQPRARDPTVRTCRYVPDRRRTSAHRSARTRSGARGRTGAKRVRVAAHRPLRAPRSHRRRAAASSRRCARRPTRGGRRTARRRTP